MKKIISILSILLLVQIAVCKNTNSQESSILKTQKKIIQLFFKGTINSNIPVELYLRVQDSLVTGHIKYKNSFSKTEILIIGEAINEKYELKEFSKNKNISGLITASVSNNKFTGIWYSPQTKKEMRIELMKVDSVLIDNTDLSAKNIVGNYGFSYGKNGANGNLKVVKNKFGKISIIFFNTSDAPARNQAYMKLENVSVDKNMVVISSMNEQLCKFKIRFLRNFVIVKYINDMRDCGFGNNAEIDGIYLK